MSNINLDYIEELCLDNAVKEKIKYFISSFISSRYLIEHIRWDPSLNEYSIWTSCNDVERMSDDLIQSGRLVEPTKALFKEYKNQLKKFNN
jgi:hypothetical protein